MEQYLDNIWDFFLDSFWNCERDSMNFKKGFKLLIKKWSRFLKMIPKQKHFKT